MSDIDNNLTLKEKMRAAHVKRWHLVRTLRDQNIAEHSFTVMLIATEIMKRAGNDVDQMGAIHGEQGYVLLRWAMWHDLLETKTGDIATPIKKKIEELAPGTMQEVEESFSPEFARVSKSTGEVVKVVVKLADMIEAISFYKEEGHGERKGEVLGLLVKGFNDYLRNMPHIYRSGYGKAAEEISAELSIPVEVWK